MDYRRLIPNMCTSSNLVFGMCSILSTYSDNLTWGSIFILLALVADGLDGRTARFFGVASEMGKEMDSLCDLGSFGIAPAFLPFQMAVRHAIANGIIPNSEFDRLFGSAFMRQRTRRYAAAEEAATRA